MRMSAPTPAPKPWQAVPAVIAPALRPGLPPLVDEVISAVRREVPEYDQPLEGEFGALIGGGVRQALEQFVDLLGTDADLPDVRAYEAMGRAEVRAGRTLDALQSAYRTGARVAWRRVVAEQGGLLDADVMYVLAEAIFAYIDRLADASVAGYTDALAARQGSVQARRQALAAALVAGTVAADELVERARRADWPVPQRLAVAAVEHEDPASLARRAPEATIGARTEDAGWLVVPDPGGPGRGRRLAAALAGVRSAVGPTVAVADAQRSAARARRGLELVLAGDLPADGPVRTDEHRLTMLLAADRPLADELRDARLGALDALTPNARARTVETLRAWLDAHGDVSRAAAVLHVHPQTVRYRLTGAREVLGDEALDDPVVRLELALALRRPG